MNENGTKRREWVKNAAIVFLTVMLLLTFFSQTIMNYSLPEVATQYVQSGTITAKIRGSGTVESGDPYEVKVTETRKVSGVAVRAGDVVEKGDVLYYLEDKDSDELTAALEALEKAEKDYTNALLNTDLTNSDIQEAENGVTIEEYRNRITAKQNAVKAAENAIKAAENDIKATENEIKEAQKAENAAEEWYNAWGREIAYRKDNPDASDEINARDNAKMALEAAQDEAAQAKVPVTEREGNLSFLEQQLELEISISGEDSEKALALKEQFLNAQNEFNDVKAVYDAKVAAVDQCQREYDRAVNALSEKIASNEAEYRYQQDLAKEAWDEAANARKEKEQQLEDRKTALEDRNTDLADRNKELDELKAQISRVSGLQDFQEAIDKAQEEVDKLREKATGATITAPISGTVTRMNITAGNSTSADTPVAVMQPEGKGYTLSFSVTNEQARRLSVGDKADLVNAWRYDDIEVTLSSIKPDNTDPGQKKMLTFEVTGSSVTAGQSLNLSVGQKSANYDLIVPNSAIREDNNGKFILIVESKSSPLGTRYTASRVDVEVIASDDTQSAISAALYGYEFVITTSTKPVEAGNLVRLASN